MVDSALRDRIIQRLLAESDTSLSAADVHDATSFRQDLNISSLTLIALATDLEDDLEINIEDDELSHIQTIGDLLRAIENSQQRNRPV